MADRPQFSGSDIDPERDDARLKTQLDLIRDLVLNQGWWQVKHIAHILSVPETSVQAQLRNLRKPQHGAYLVTKKALAAVYTYKVEERDKDNPYQPPTDSASRKHALDLNREVWRNVALTELLLKVAGWLNTLEEYKAATRIREKVAEINKTKPKELETNDED